MGVRDARRFMEQAVMCFRLYDSDGSSSEHIRRHGSRTDDGIQDATGQYLSEHPNRLGGGSQPVFATIVTRGIRRHRCSRPRRAGDRPAGGSSPLPDTGSGAAVPTGFRPSRSRVPEFGLCIGPNTRRFRGSGTTPTW
jgi:hypothetical protein